MNIPQITSFINVNNGSTTEISKGGIIAITGYFLSYDEENPTEGFFIQVDNGQSFPLVVIDKQVDINDYSYSYLLSTDILGNGSAYIYFKQGNYIIRFPEDNSWLTIVEE